MRKQCSQPDCTRPNFSHGLCATHRTRKNKGQSLDKPIQTYNRFVDGYKVCPKCKVKQHRDDYYTRPNGNPTARCKKCMKEAQAARMARLKEATRSTETALREPESIQVGDSATINVSSLTEASTNE